jgi:ribose/xylose/arabinose/galactoside ABC-type transport system permease subunit
MSYSEGFRFRNDGFRDEYRDDPEPAQSYQSGSYPVADYSAPETSSTQGISRRAVTPAELDEVFDDPGDADRMMIHVIWEVVLLVAVAGLAFWFRHGYPTALSGAGLRALLVSAAALGFLTLGAGISLRAGVPNLAIGPVAVAAGLFMATHSDRGIVMTTAIAMLGAALVGLAAGLAVAILQVPGWAASLAAGFGVVVWIQKHANASPITASYHPEKHAYYWYGGFAALALLGGILGMIRPIRRGVGRFRPNGDPALHRGTGAAIVALVVLAASSAMAGLGGVLLALGSKSVGPTDGLIYTGLALAAALVGGTSAYGRRGGILGTVLAATLLTLLIGYGNAANLKMSNFAIAAAGIVIGLVVTRLIETFGRPRGSLDEPTAYSAGGDANWSAGRTTGGWTTQLPARATDDTWAGSGGEDRWGTR